MSNFNQELCQQILAQNERILRLMENRPVDPVVVPVAPVVVPVAPVVVPVDPVDPVVAPVVAPVARRRRNRQAELEIIEEQQDSYTADEIKQMNDYTMIAETIRITGEVMLSCKHCKKHTHISNFLHSIRKRCEKKGLDRNFQLPKTCDRQQAVNSMCNPVNNKFYPVMRSNCSQQKKQKFIDAREVCFAAVGIQTNPTTYR